MTCFNDLLADFQPTTFELVGSAVLIYQELFCLLDCGVAYEVDLLFSQGVGLVV